MARCALWTASASLSASEKFLPCLAPTARAKPPIEILKATARQSGQRARAGAKPHPRRPAPEAADRHHAPARWPLSRPHRARRAALYAQFYERPANPEALLERVGLQSAAKTRCRQLSGGQKRRLLRWLWRLWGSQRLVFLDEPTASEWTRKRGWQPGRIIRDLRREGATVLLTTHLMDEAEKLADHVAIIDHGRLIALDTPTALTGGAAAGMVRFSAPAGLDSRSPGSLALGARSARNQPRRLRTAHNQRLSAAGRIDSLVTRPERYPYRGAGWGMARGKIFLQLTGTEVRL